MKIPLLNHWRASRDIRKSGFFDPVYYAAQVPDDPALRSHPIRHYLNTGWRENRNPSEKFDTAYYLRTNPDVKQAGINPLVHYLRHGQYEGRAPRPGHTGSPPTRYRVEGFQDRLYRWVFQAGKRISWLIPARLRGRLIARVKAAFGSLFDRGSAGPDASGGAFARQALVALDTVDPAREPRGSIAIHIHLFYRELAREFAQYLKNIPFPFDLFLSIPEDGSPGEIQALFERLPHCSRVTIKPVPNRGRDIAPFLVAFGPELARYDYVAHLHSKRSDYNQGATSGWRKYLCGSLLGSPATIRRIFTLLQGSHSFGIVYPQNFARLPYWANTWLANRKMGEAWCARLGIRDVPRGYFDYPASSMFWAQREALAPLFQAGLTLEDFPPEAGQTDGTLAHCLERLFVLCSQQQGRRAAILADETHPSWSAWRFDQYLKRPEQEFLRLAHSPGIRLIAFDIFDSLLCRPLLDPGTIKELVAVRLPGKTGQLYRELRFLAEGQARESKGADVGLDEIYRRLGQISGLSKARLAQVRETELAVEEACLSVRPGARELLQAARDTGKPLVLISDMFLPSRTMASWLKKLGLSGWQRIYVSGDIGLRKEDGRLYEHVLHEHGLAPGELLMVGDNERSDVQVPCDMGSSFYHLMRPVEAARNTPRLAALVAEHERRADLNAELTLGLVLRRNFGPLTYPALDPDELLPVSPRDWGYGLVGPLLTGFADWLLRESRQAGLARLYFLAREGRILQQVYDAWAGGEERAPRSVYLVLSRRAAGVAAISGPEDIATIARTVYYPNTLANFLHTRYGITPDGGRWQQVLAASGLRPESEVSVAGQNIKALLPVLKVLEEDILARAALERQALAVYLKDLGLEQDDRQAVVDVGYGGSVQAYLNRLLPRRLHGCYLMTEQRAQAVARQAGVAVKGCLHENIDRDGELPPLYRHSFELEKLLSSDDAQVESYRLDRQGKAHGCFRALTAEEQACDRVRAGIRAGALEYVQDAVRLRATIKPDFRPSTWSAARLLESFLEHPARAEKQMLAAIVLDDHYCGRGLVS